MSDWQFDRPDGLPAPNPPAEAEGFFAALGEGRLAIQRCRDCGELTHPPRSMCRHCRGSRFEWQPVSGRGSVYSYTVTHQPIHPALVDHTPFATVQVQLEEGPMLVSNLVDVPPEAITIGMPVEVVFQRIDESLTLPLFKSRR